MYFMPLSTYLRLAVSGLRVQPTKVIDNTASTTKTMQRLRIPSPGSPRDDLIDVSCNLFCKRQSARTCLLLITVVDRSGDTNQSGVSTVQAHGVIHQIELTPVFAGHYAAMRLVPIQHELL